MPEEWEALKLHQLVLHYIKAPIFQDHNAKSSSITLLTLPVIFAYIYLMSEWKAYYVFQGDQYSMALSSFGFNCAAAEGVVFGNGSDEVGEFLIEGTTKNQLGQICCIFEKRYIQAHTIFYSGKFNAGQTVIEGDWGWQQGSKVEPFKIYK